MILGNEVYRELKKVGYEQAYGPIFVYIRDNSTGKLFKTTQRMWDSVISQVNVQITREFV